MARKKKKIIYNIDYWIVIPTRLSREIFKDNQYIDVFDKENIKYYLDNTNTNIKSINALNNGKALLINASIYPDNSISDIVFNIKRLAFKYLFKLDNIKDKLNGEKSIWSQDYVVSFNKEDAIMSYYKLIGGDNNDSNS